MNKFNKKSRDYDKIRKEKSKDRKRGLRTHRANAEAVSGARTGKSQRKQIRKLQKAQSEAIRSGLVTLTDIEMLAAENEEKVAVAIGSDTPAVSGEKKKKGGFKVGKKTIVKARRMKRLTGGTASASTSSGVNSNQGGDGAEPMQE